MTKIMSVIYCEFLKIAVQKEDEGPILPEAVCGLTGKSIDMVRGIPLPKFTCPLIIDRLRDRRCRVIRQTPTSTDVLEPSHLRQKLLG
jgi:hypothetical protein